MNHVMFLGNIFFLLALIVNIAKSYSIRYVPQHAPNNVTEAFLNCLEDSLGHLDFNVTTGPIGRINMMPSTRRNFTPEERQAILHCINLASAHLHFESQSAVYEDEFTLRSTDISCLRTFFDYRLQIIEGTRQTSIGNFMGLDIDLAINGYSLNCDGHFYSISHSYVTFFTPKGDTQIKYYA